MLITYKNKKLFMQINKLFNAYTYKNNKLFMQIYKLFNAYS